MSGEELPEGWAETTLDDLAVVKGGITKGPKQRSEETARLVPYLRVANVQRGRLDLTEVSEIEASERAIEDLRLEPGDVLFNEGGDRDKLGRGWVWEGQLPLCIHQNHVFRARVRGDVIAPKFLSHYGNTLGQRYFFDEGKQSTNLASINLSKLSALPVLVPPRREQDRILEKLEAVQVRSRRAKEALDAVPALLEQFRRAVLASAFRGDLTAAWREKNQNMEPAEQLLARIRRERRQWWEGAELAKMLAKGKKPADDRWKERHEEPAPVDTEGLPELPEGWCWARFDDICLESMYGPRFAANDYVAAPDGVPTLRTTDMNSRGDFRLKDPPRVQVSVVQVQELGCQDGDLLVTRTGSIGKCAVYDRAIGDALPSAYLIRFRLMRSAVMPKFVLATILTPRVQELLGLGATAVTQPNINARTIGAIPIAVCGVAEQIEILGRLDRLWAFFDSVEARLSEGRDDLAHLDRAILGRAFRGDLVPQDPADEPASTLLARLRAEREQPSPAAAPARKPRRKA
jgi:type I restriction enzyme S subunit